VPGLAVSQFPALYRGRKLRNYQAADNSLRFWPPFPEVFGVGLCHCPDVYTLGYLLLVQFSKYTHPLNTLGQHQVELCQEDCSLDGRSRRHIVQVPQKTKYELERRPMKIIFTTAIRTSLQGAAVNGLPYLDINSGHLHRLVGGYPGPNHRMPVCCGAMRGEMQPGDIIIDQPPKGNGASLTIRYRLPRTFIIWRSPFGEKRGSGFRTTQNLLPRP